jgi:hypothetical protein
VITRFATDLFQRVAALTPSEWLTAIGVAALIGAIAWIGRNVGKVIDAHAALAARVQAAEANLVNAEDAVLQLDERITRVDEAVARRVRNTEVRQDRLQSKVENWGKNWRDSGQQTKNLELTGPMTIIELSKP